MVNLTVPEVKCVCRTAADTSHVQGLAEARTALIRTCKVPSVNYLRGICALLVCLCN